jgi:hypothetical protein
VPIACRSVYVPGIAALCALLGFPGASEAHFVLTSPPAVFEQNALGDPQKAPPCGDAGMAVATGVVTSYQGGETITVTIEETIFHPGHYRIALALDDGVFPDEPPVTPGATPCGSAPIDLTPAFPVLADGVWEHTEPFAGSQSIDITLPDDVSCTNCTLQVIQFMSNHALNDPGGCYYHHCAAIAVDGDPGVTTTSPGDDSSGGSSSDGPPPVTTAAGSAKTAGARVRRRASSRTPIPARCPWTTGTTAAAAAARSREPTAMQAVPSECCWGCSGSRGSGSDVEAPASRCDSAIAPC